MKAVVLVSILGSENLPLGSAPAAAVPLRRRPLLRNRNACSQETKVWQATGVINHQELRHNITSTLNIEMSPEFVSIEQLIPKTYFKFNFN